MMTNMLHLDVSVHSDDHIMIINYCRGIFRILLPSVHIGERAHS